MFQGNQVAVFNSLFARPVFFSRTYWNKLKSGKTLSKDIERALRKTKIISSEKEDSDFLSHCWEIATQNEGVSILYLILTSFCNFRCRYCFQGERHGQVNTLKHMTKEIAKKGIDAFVRHLKPDENYDVQIQLYGGEPLLNWEVFVFSVEYIESLVFDGHLPKTTRIIVVTNGSLLDEEKARFIKSHKISVGLSLDGPKKLNDSNRRTLSGRSAYNQASEALSVLKKFKIPTTFSITVSPDNVGSLRDLVLWAKGIGIKSIGFNPMGGLSYGYVGSKMKKECYDELLVNGIVTSFKKARDLGIYEDRLGRKVTAFVNHDFVFSDCGAINSQLVIQPDGMIGFCHASRAYNVGSVFDEGFLIFDKGQIGKWRSSLPIYNQDCQRCAAVSICGYGCFHNVVEETGSTEKGDKQFCAYTKHFMDFLIWDLYHKSRKG